MQGNLVDRLFSFFTPCVSFETLFRQDLVVRHGAEDVIADLANHVAKCLLHDGQHDLDDLPPILRDEGVRGISCEHTKNQR